MKHIHLKELIEELEKMPADAVIPFGFGEPDSYRGYYHDLAFEPLRNAKVEEMLSHAKSALGATFTGYKGGEYTMGEYTDCWIAAYGCSAGDKIGKTLIDMWNHSINTNKEE